MMTPKHKSARSSHRAPAGAKGLPRPERAELQRQGAKAAARGDKATSNPMNDLSNKPTSTGESADIWRERQQAWQQGHDDQSGASAGGTPPPGSPQADGDRD